MLVHRIQNLLIVLILAQVPCKVAAEDYESNLIVALDFSTSYYGADRFASIEDNFFKLLDAMDSRRLKKPLLFQVIPIDHISQAGGALCKFRLLKKKLLKKGDGACGRRKQGCSADPKDLGDYVEEVCLPTVLERGQGGATDIEGALSLAGQFAMAQTSERRYLVIMSDMEQYRNEALINTEIDLSGFDVLVVCGGQVLQTQTGFCMSSQGFWEDRLEGYGARSVRFAVEQSEWATAAIEMF